MTDGNNMNMFYPSRSVKTASAMIGLAALVAFAPMAIADRDRSQSEMRDVAEFDEVVVAGAMDLIVEVGGSQSVEIEVDEGYLDRVETEVRNGVLTIKQKGRRWRDVDLEVRITVPSMKALLVEGAADATIRGVQAQEFRVDIEGAVDLYIEGTCDTLDIEINGAGDINAREFLCAHVEVEINGAGDADVFASESIEATLNGIGDVTVYGDPREVRPRIHGLGSFELRD